VLAVAEQPRLAAGVGNLRFVEADARTYRDPEPFDAVVGRLIWCYLADPVEVLRHHAAGLTDDGLMLAIDQDCGSVRCEPPVPLVDALVGWAIEVHTRAGANPMIGAQLGVMLREAGLTEIETLGIQSYLGPNDPAGPALLSGIVRTVAPSIVAGGLATEVQLGLDSLEERVARDLGASRATFLLPAVAGAWGRRRASPGGADLRLV
jgi:SAM-dependent methyltransferase